MSKGNSRKLMLRPQLAYAHTLRGMGVPVSRIISELELDVSIPVVTKLINIYNEMYTSSEPEQASKIEQSLFPTWLDEGGKPIQGTPTNWSYNGFFPFGQWIENKDEA